MGFAYFFAYSAQVTMITELIPQARSTTMSANYFVTYMGMTLGSAVAGQVLARSDYPFVGLLSAVSCLLAAVVAERFVFTSRPGGVTS
jgi:predicted MFS family arabinose efflux permease